MILMNVREDAVNAESELVVLAKGFKLFRVGAALRLLLDLPKAFF